MGFEKAHIFLVVVLVSLVLCFGSGSGMSSANSDHGHHHHCDQGHGHGHDHHHHHNHDHGHHRHRHVEEERKKMVLPEELAEEEDMTLYGFGPYGDDHGHDHHELSNIGLWSRALGCSLLYKENHPRQLLIHWLYLGQELRWEMLFFTSCHILLVVNTPTHMMTMRITDHAHHAHTGHDHVHAHSFKDLSVGLSVLAGIVLFLLVEKLVRYVEENSGGDSGWSHGHHHHHHKSNKKLKNDDDASHDNSSQPDITGDPSNVDNANQPEIRKRKSSGGTCDGKLDIGSADGFANSVKTSVQKETSHSQSNLVFGYLNLFSDGVHNFTDGMALGSAFLLHGSVGGWSRTLFLLAHELPQEIGNFGILLRSGFSVSTFLFFNFLSALVAPAGTTMALFWGQDPGQSSLIEWFTAGGFIYFAVAGALADLNNSGKTTLKNTAVQLISLTSGMAVALCISLVE